MKNIKRYIFWLPLLILVVIALLWWNKDRLAKEEKQQQMLLQLNQLRGVAKLVIWEQDFTLNNKESLERTYIGIIKAKESIMTTVNGSMGFHIDLADSVHTQLIRKGDSIIIQAPLENTYIQLDLGSLKQVKEASLDPTLELKKEEVIKSLQQKALDEFVPNLRSNLSQKDLHYQEQKLSQLVNAPVRIQLTDFPQKGDFNWKGFGRE